MSIALYELLDTKTNTRLPAPVNTLRMARALRRSYNKEHQDPLRFIVVPGPAHPKFKK